MSFDRVVLTAAGSDTVWSHYTQPFKLTEALNTARRHILSGYYIAGCLITRGTCLCMLYPCSGMTLVEVITSMFDGKLNNVQPCVSSDRPPELLACIAEQRENAWVENDTISTPSLIICGYTPPAMCVSMTMKRGLMFATKYLGMLNWSAGIDCSFSSQ